MIDGLIAGRLYGTPKENTGKNDNRFVTARVRAAAGDGETLFVNVIAFNQVACDGLMALNDGDSVSLSGSITPKVWTDQNGVGRPALDLVTHGVLTAYHVRKKRSAFDKGQAGGDDGLPQSTL